MNFKDFKDKYQKIEPEHFPNSVSLDPVVSICIQSYNHERYIHQCLDSILTQELDFSYEILIGEDNSSDKTRELCINYALKYPDKIRLFLHHTENKIKVDSLYTGNFNSFYNFYQARGKFIAFCDGDDYWTDPKKLKTQIKILEENQKYVLCYHSFSESYEGKNLSENELDQPKLDLSQNELQRLKFHPQLSTVCFRNILQELPEEMIKVINLDSFLLSFLGYFGKAKFCSNIQPNVYRRHGDGIWSGEAHQKKLLIKINTYTQLSRYHKRYGNGELGIHFKLIKHNIVKSLFIYYLTNHPLKAFLLIPDLLRTKSLKF
ncbi:glycosyltransferase [Gramella sp. KN1008]|uniref:glycosyltransferase family 2 protein n=1 Tax=Gramella sp. KN1008 TaxID=2529298 RepID=UPI00103973D8|nr:glycosyltransferase [Gramella sp. KN1008]TBW25602.1 glycosyltransferase [Gramella sp. KN1008]